MSFGIYLTGFMLVVAGLLYGASLMHVPTHWIVVSGIVLVGLGILTGVKATRQKDSAT
jgi:cadmium resistance protein CadD (predicted permease)